MTSARSRSTPAASRSTGAATSGSSERRPCARRWRRAFLWRMGFDGTHTVVDPMCGSGTIPLEAAEIAAGLMPGRDRAFAFEAMIGGVRPGIAPRDAVPGGAVPRLRTGTRARSGGRWRMPSARVWRAFCRFACQPVSALEPPEGPPGIVLTNPPYGARIGNRKTLLRSLREPWPRAGRAFRGLAHRHRHQR